MSALTASASFLGMISGPIAAAADAKLCELSATLHEIHSS
jgi:hypothetical protein